MKAGRNTPQSVLSYIDAVLTQEEIDPLVLATELGYSPKAYRKLKEKHGDGLAAYLVKAKRLRTDSVRRLSIRRLREDPQNMTTIVPLGDRPPNPPEPERVGRDDEDVMAERSSESEIMYLRQHWAAKRAQIDQCIAELREAGLNDRELWIIERRMARLDAKLAA